MTERQGQLRCAKDCVFGPVPSRRLGKSLGVNTVPGKTCTHSCIYCQLGRTARRTVERREYYDADELSREVLARLECLALNPDYVTFLGCGEPTLASNLGAALRGVSSGWKGKTALLTNGALLWMEDVRVDALEFDVVMPTISAGNPRLFRQMHRPHPSLGFEKVTEGIRRFASQYSGALWIEVMLLGGVNDDRKSLEEIASVLQPIRADRIHLTAPIRPPTLSRVRCPTREAIELAKTIIPGSVDTTGPEEGSFDSIRSRVVEDLLGMARVHPMREEQVMDVFQKAGVSRQQGLDILKKLQDQGRITSSEHRDVRFYRTLE